MYDTVLMFLFVLALGMTGAAFAVHKDIEVQGAGHMAGITLKLPVQ